MFRIADIRRKSEEKEVEGGKEERKIGNVHERVRGLSVKEWNLREEEP